eukprot:11659228-Ditylum_brightwellii.AAC.1
MLYHQWQQSESQLTSQTSTVPMHACGNSKGKNANADRELHITPPGITMALSNPSKMAMPPPQL